MSLFKSRADRDKYREKVEVILTKEGIIIRLVFLVIFLSIASYAFYSIFTKVLHTESGWQMVTANTKSSVGTEFAFHYQIGVSGKSASQEWGQLNKLYPVLLDEGANIYGNNELVGTGNLYQLNTHINEEVYVEPALYDALVKAGESGSRLIYYAPVFAKYKSLFLCDNEYAAMDFDPFYNPEVAEYVKTICSFAADEKHINIELADSGMAKLSVSDEYLNFVHENEIEYLVDLGYARNAFIMDYVADRLIENGFTAGVITSVEGFVRALGEGDYSINRYFYEEGSAPKESVYSYKGPASLISLRDFPLYREDNEYFFEAEDGSLRHIFIDPQTGLSREGLHQLIARSEKLGISDMIFPLYDYFVNATNLNVTGDEISGSDAFFYEKAYAFPDKGIVLE